MKNDKTSLGTAGTTLAAVLAVAQFGAGLGLGFALWGSDSLPRVMASEERPADGLEEAFQATARLAFAREAAHTFNATRAPALTHVQRQLATLAHRFRTPEPQAYLRGRLAETQDPARAGTLLLLLAFSSPDASISGLAPERTTGTAGDRERIGQRLRTWPRRVR
jgi:hypothetical protein